MPPRILAVVAQGNAEVDIAGTHKTTSTVLAIRKLAQDLPERRGQVLWREGKGLVETVAGKLRSRTTSFLSICRDPWVV